MMKYHHLVLLCIAFISIFLTKTAYSDSKVTILDTNGKSVDSLHFTPKKSIQLTCKTEESGNINIVWQKDGKPVESLSGLKDRIELKDTNKTILEIKDLKESDVGNYTCAIFKETNKIAYHTVSLNTATSSKWAIRVPKNSNVVEGEKLTIKCDVRGELTLEWMFKNASIENANWTVIPGENPRFSLKDYFDEKTKINITNGLLLIDESNMGDRGDYICIGKSADGQNLNSTCTVRVKDKYAALWPFLGICAEVFVLCAIIFIYEKKRNKTELEESDTDQSPDQKNTPDHGKDSNLRHRQ